MKDFISNLNKKMIEDFASVNPIKNPVAQKISLLSFKEFLYIFEQYSLFSKNITNFLLKGFYSVSYYGWAELSLELIQNIREELNVDDSCFETHRVPHYLLLRQGFADANIDIGNVKASLSTKNFMSSTLEIMENTNPNIVAGGVYALESSAVPELNMVYTWVEKAFDLAQQKVPKKISTFFKSHVEEIEVGHEARLQEVCRLYIRDSKQIQNFEIGFCSIISIMDRWWQELMTEALLSEHVS